MIHELVRAALAAVPLDRTMEDLAEICRHDRYQASPGIQRAAEFVAERARGVRSLDVELHQFPGDGGQHWWTFRAPWSWAPERAVLEIRASADNVLVLDHAQSPFAMATYSAHTSPQGDSCNLVELSVATPDSMAGALVIVGRADYALERIAPLLIAAGARGFVTDGPGRSDDWGREWRGRIELPPNTPLLAFSLTSSELKQVQELRRQGATAHVAVNVDRSAGMPVVTAVRPGTVEGGEIWLTSHLCHPRPGANDNGSGCAALLAIAAMLRTSAGAVRPIRFVWGPEYVGVVALLHRHLQAGRPLPHAVLNLDMVGEDQNRCGSPFVYERAPDLKPSLLNPLAEGIVSEVFRCTDRHPGRWEPSPFMGFSDHALFADPRLAVPAAQIAHVPDRFNHSAADTLDKVSPGEMTRSIAAAYVIASALSSDSLLSSLPLRGLVQDWCNRELREAEQISERLHVDTEDEQGLLSYTRSRNAQLLALAAGDASVERSLYPPRLATNSPRLVSTWRGPLNLRELLEHASAEARATAYALVRKNKRNLALLFYFAVLADGRRTARQIVLETAYSKRWQIDDGVAAQLMDALLDSGWIQPAQRSPEEYAFSPV
jgi:hypothetical protein